MPNITIFIFNNFDKNKPLILFKISVDVRKSAQIRNEKNDSYRNLRKVVCV